jgi:anti-sigma regulatory factor (Ser/Thr protein kinase)
MQSDPGTLDESPVANSAARTFAARFSIVPETARFVESFCASHGIARDDRLRLTLIVEELVANTILHGHRVECDAPIVLALCAGADGISLRYEDTAPAFDLAAALSNAADVHDTEFELRPMGNVGLRLVANYATGVRYVRDNGYNRVTLTLRTPA